MRTVRTLVSLGFLVLLGGAGAWLWWDHTAKDREIAEQQRIIKDLEGKLDRAWESESVADVRVDSIERDAAGASTMHLTFVQYEPGTEKPMFSRPLVLTGEEFYIDALVVSFDRELVEAGDGLRGKGMLLFRRAFGDQQRPADGPILFAVDGPIPEGLRVDPAPSDFEQQIWRRFWTLANDPVKAKEAGVRMAQGEAPHVRAVPGQVYRLKLRASGGLEVTPLLSSALVGDPPPPR